MRESMSRAGGTVRVGMGFGRWHGVMLSLLVGLGAGCAPAAYVKPKPGEPYADVKIRRVYHASAGQTLTEYARIDGHPVFQHGRYATDTGPQTSAVPVHPLLALWTISAGFSHVEQRWVSEAYTVYTTQMVSETTYQQQSYSCGSYSSGRYTSQTCYRSVPQHRMVSRQVPQTRYRQVLRPVSVSDGECGRQVNFHPGAGQVYLLEFSYMGPSVCTLTCLVQSPGAGGQALNAPCPAESYGRAAR